MRCESLSTTPAASYIQSMRSFGSLVLQGETVREFNREGARPSSAVWLVVTKLERMLCSLSVLTESTYTRPLVTRSRTKQESRSPSLPPLTPTLLSSPHLTSPILHPTTRQPGHHLTSARLLAARATWNHIRRTEPGCTVWGLGSRVCRSHPRRLRCFFGACPVGAIAFLVCRPFLGSQVDGLEREADCCKEDDP